MAAKNFYEVLGVSKDAPLDQIKKSYRKLARKHHPDVNPGDKAAEERFKEISAAFEVLSDPEKRKLYDEFGEDATKIGFDPEKARAYREWRDRPQQSEETYAQGHSGFGEFDLDDLLGGMFRGRASRGGFGPEYEEYEAEPAQTQGADAEASLTIELLEALRGGEREISLNKPVRCATCGGTGHLANSGDPTCKRCNGRGRINVSQGPLRFESVCPVCHGTGKEPGPICGTCNGSGVRQENVNLKVKIPAGVKDGQKIRLRGQGMPGRMGGPNGDLLITIHVSPHNLLKRDGDDLYLEVPITAKEAIYGTKIDVPTLDGSVKLTIPAGSQSGQKLRLKGKGAPAKDGHGDLYVTLSVRVPEVSPEDDAVKNAIEELEKQYKADVRASLRL